ncbi:MAG: hypothetical protein E4H26_03280 [Flavobacteriales bacterium]|nr:MAG: hypothetical protein E4H26_03280 [Flavobacteriales bacterium]
MKTSEQLISVIRDNLDTETIDWLLEKLEVILISDSAKDLYLTYTLIAAKVSARTDIVYQKDTEIIGYLKAQEANLHQIVRIFLLAKVLEEKPTYFTAKVANLIQVADTAELVTFLKFLVWLPNPKTFNQTAVEALRTNISQVFMAIALNNPYPEKFFTEQQWNQMYLKAAFMQLDLGAIIGVDERANEDLARIISDYAHERWAASRDIDPLFWRPVVKFLKGTLKEDMNRLLSSQNLLENKAGVLCCFRSEDLELRELMGQHPEIMNLVSNDRLTWENFKQ